MMSDSPSRDQVVSLVVDALFACLHLESTVEVTVDSVIVEDLRADSLDLVEIMMKIEELVEERFGVSEFTIEDEEAEDIRTVGNAVDFVLSKIS